MLLHTYQYEAVCANICSTHVEENITTELNSQHKKIKAFDVTNAV